MSKPVKRPRVSKREEVVGRFLRAYGSLERLLRGHVSELAESDVRLFVRLHDGLRQCLVHVHHCDTEGCPLEGKEVRT